MAEPSELNLSDKFGEGNEAKAPTKPKENSSFLSNYDSCEEPSNNETSVNKPNKTGNSVDFSGEPEGKSAGTEHQAARSQDSSQADDNSIKRDQKKTGKMEKDIPNDGSDGKGTMVQLVQVLRYSQTDWNKLKQEMELNFQSTLLNKERDWSLLLADRDKKVSVLEETNSKLKQTNEDMRMVVTEFEKTISQLQADKEKNRTDSSKSLQTVEHERDQAMEDLASVENAFSDLHRRYEKSKTIIDGFKRNEEQLKQCVDDLQNKIKKSESKMQMIKSQAEEQLDKANQDIDKLRKSTQQDIIRLEAALKKSELRISSLEESSQRKEKENQELTAICDELIAKVGT